VNATCIIPELAKFVDSIADRDFLAGIDRPVL
jgi:hypothetical protein